MFVFGHRKKRGKNPKTKSQWHHFVMLQLHHKDQWDCFELFDENGCVLAKMKLRKKVYVKRWDEDIWTRHTHTPLMAQYQPMKLHWPIELERCKMIHLMRNCSHKRRKKTWLKTKQKISNRLLWRSWRILMNKYCVRKWICYNCICSQFNNNVNSIFCCWLNSCGSHHISIN